MEKDFLGTICLFAYFTIVIYSTSLVWEYTLSSVYSLPLPYSIYVGDTI